ncbi:MAG: hypothetical protein Q7O66_01155 [Dehalococcoidia bacterium]|nr:hypothetical protein [Dehalococcoidia bacterium]
MDRLYSIVGQPPDLSNLPAGCTFAPRCHQAQDRCEEEYPPVVHLSDRHQVRCWRLARTEVVSV